MAVSAHRSISAAYTAQRSAAQHTTAPAGQLAGAATLLSGVGGLRFVCVPLCQGDGQFEQPSRLARPSGPAAPSLCLLPIPCPADLYMAVLLQQVVPAQYAFVLHTADPLSGEAHSCTAHAACLASDFLASASHLLRTTCLPSFLLITCRSLAATLLTLLISFIVCRLVPHLQPCTCVFVCVSQARRGSCTASWLWAWARRW